MSNSDLQKELEAKTWNGYRMTKCLCRTCFDLTDGEKTETQKGKRKVPRVSTGCT